MCTPPEQVYVGRGGYKLKAALEFFEIDVNGLVCVDIGASTGGFTDCLLKNGAKKVYAVDNGTDQLVSCLLTDIRVVSMEKLNAKELLPDMFSEIVDFICVDVSFISVTNIIVSAAAILRVGGMLVCLIKPQFESGKGSVNNRGIVRNTKLHDVAIEKVRAVFSEAGLVCRGIIRSPIAGADGNVEYLGCFLKVQA
jgi:23S rRNA (cytidine1920-2'-O)/16S rRNA (cytidine1409-2'-O)-methyltransferase